MNKLTRFLPCALLAVSATASAQDYASIHKQLDIMSDIIKSSVSVQDGRKRSKITGIDSTYLKGQGVVFTISSGSSARSWGNYNFSFTMPEVPPVPSVPVVAHSDSSSYSFSDNQESFEIDIDETVTEALESATQGYERAMEALHENRDKYRELRDEQRDLAYEVRDLEREARDLEYQLRRANDKQKKELKAEVEKIEQQKAKLAKERKQVQEKVAKLKQRQEAEQKERAQERVAFYKQLTTSITETLCLYGNGLKSLPKNEHVSVILKSAGEKKGRRYQDKIFVFSKKDIAACSADKINVAKLLEKGQGYQF